MVRSLQKVSPTEIPGIVFGIIFLCSSGEVEEVKTQPGRGKQPSSLVGVSSSILLCCCDDSRAPRDWCRDELSRWCCDHVIRYA